MFDVPLGMAAPVPASEPAREPLDAAPPRPPILPPEPVRAVRTAPACGAFGPGAPALHAFIR